MTGNLQYLIEFHVIGEVNLKKHTCSHNSLQFYITLLLGFNSIVAISYWQFRHQSGIFTVSEKENLCSEKLNLVRSSYIYIFM